MACDGGGCFLRNASIDQMVLPEGAEDGVKNRLSLPLHHSLLLSGISAHVIDQAVCLSVCPSVRLSVCLSSSQIDLYHGTAALLKFDQTQK